MNSVSIQSFILQSQKPGNTAITSSEGITTYSDLNRETSTFANYLLNKGIKRKDRAAVVYNHSAEFIKIIIGLWKIGAIPVVMNLRLTDSELIEQIKFSECDKIIIEKKSNLLKTYSDKNKIFYPENLTEVNSEINQVEKDDIALIIFTSGSTGKPKAVVHTYDSLYQSAVISNQILEQNNESRWLASLPFYHIGGFSIITRSLVYGCSIIIPDSLKTELISAAINNYSPTHCSLVPTQLKRLIESGIKPNRELKKILIGGGWINNNLSDTALQNGWEIIKVYGSTETASMATAIRPEEILENHLSVGKILNPNKIKIIDNSGKELPVNLSGEILINSPALCKEYLNNPGETRAKLIDGWYHTGDIGYLDKNGFLFLESRRTDLIVSGGENINPSEIENVIESHKCVSEVCVIGVKDNEWGQIAAAAVVLKKNCSLSENDLRAFLKEKLASYKIPKQIKFVENLPKSDLEKTLREKVKEFFNV